MFYDGYIPESFLDSKGNFLGYNGELGTIVAQKLNLTLDLIKIESWGVKTKDGIFTGSLKDLKDNNIDVGKYFEHI